MKKQILTVSPVQTAKVLAVFYFVVSLPMILLMAIPILLAPGPTPGMPGWFLLAMPFLYAIFGFIFTVIGAWIYNQVASQIGGIEYTSADVHE